MERFTKVVAGISRVMDRIAGFCLAGVVVMVVANIIARRIFNSPFWGSMSMWGF